MHRVEIRDIKVNKLEEEEKIVADSSASGESPNLEDQIKPGLSEKPKRSGNRNNNGKSSDIQRAMDNMGGQNQDDGKELLSVLIKKIPYPPFNFSFSLETQLNHLIDLYSKIM